MIRFFDLLFSLIGVILLLPLFLLIMLLILPDPKCVLFYLHERVGRHGKSFRLIKFRTMRPGSDRGINLTIGARDSRITPAGRLLRRYKLDELPQLFNVVRGEMSLVGPRPEVRKYVDLYSDEQRRVLEVRPGITDEASIAYFDENELLGRSSNPEETYIREVMPAKILLNMQFINDPSLKNYFRILGKTFLKLLR
jgi:lipopolysaccharide/colanic/teichoic acid biosynthesis glycosyltransferase